MRTVSDTTPPLDVSHNRGGTKTNAVRSSAFCFLTAAQGFIKHVIY